MTSVALIIAAFTVTAATGSALYIQFAGPAAPRRLALGSIAGMAVGILAILWAIWIVP
jgi:hypothetical protein